MLVLSLFFKPHINNILQVVIGISKTFDMSLHLCFARSLPGPSAIGHRGRLLLMDADELDLRPFLLKLPTNASKLVRNRAVPLMLVSISLV